MLIIYKLFDRQMIMLNDNIISRFQRAKLFADHAAAVTDPKTDGQSEGRCQL